MKLSLHLIKITLRARNYYSNLGFLSENLPQNFDFLPEDPSLSFSTYLTIPRFPVGNPAKNLGFRHHFRVSWTSGNPVISSPALLHSMHILLGVFAPNGSIFLVLTH